MKLADLQALIAAGESEVLEFKERFNTDVIETLVALANTRGGRVVIGVTDTGKPTAQDFGKEALRDYVNRVATATEPVVIPEAEKYTTPEGEIIVLTVGEFPLKPVATRGRCYRRAGSTTRQMPPSEIAEMHLHSTGQSMDAVIVADKTSEDLDLEAVRQYMRQATALGAAHTLGRKTPGKCSESLNWSRRISKSPAPPSCCLAKTRSRHSPRL